MNLLGFENLQEFDANSMFAAMHLKTSLIGEAEIEKLIATRLEMLRVKNFAEADRIRDDLLAKGIQLKDGKDAATGERTTTWEVRR